MLTTIEQKSNNYLVKYYESDNNDKENRLWFFEYFPTRESAELASIYYQTHGRIMSYQGSNATK